jgi:hypothetical protein
MFVRFRFETWFVPVDDPEIAPDQKELALNPMAEPTSMPFVTVWDLKAGSKAYVVPLIVALTHRCIIVTEVIVVVPLTLAG